ncbi:MAG: biotin transporter BioY [Candidatus Limivivens sp.]|nr:biotin transporter BioY [Candidatus Limivivens sp.]
MKMKSKTQMLAYCALFAALTAVCSQIQIPLPMVPINLALFSVHLSALLLGKKYGALSQAIYILLAAVGVPVMAGLTGGLGALLGKTGGYAIGYILSAFITGLICEKWGYAFWKMCIAAVVGCAACYVLGTIWFMVVTELDLGTSLAYCVWPFLPGDAVKILLAGAIAVRLRPVLKLTAAAA